LTIRATGNAIVKALILIELVKRRVGDLHQRNKIYSMEIESFEESKIEGMEKIATKRRVTAMDTELSKDVLDENDPGYQKPEPKEEGPAISNPPKPKEKKGKSKKHRGPKLYNTPLNKDGEEAKDA
jgi:ribonuclease P/MRP protein subunit RPP25